ncbi:L-arabinose isomerase 1 [Clostridia bacterium]|nr:L-arabinose isomerase 1 [Clostridia bacterium]
MKNKTVYFITGSQDLYGEETLRQVAADGKVIADYLNRASGNPVTFVYKDVVKNSAQIEAVCKAANNDGACVGVIAWMHTFSPAKMWVHGLLALQKPLLHLHTQANEKLPYESIDMDFMNLNQAAHGDREFGFIGSRLRLRRKVAVGYYKDETTLAEVFAWARSAAAFAFSRTLKVARFGDNMRSVAVTEGDKIEAHVKLGWTVDYYGVGDLTAEIGKVTAKETDALYAEYKTLYAINTPDVDAVKEQAKYEIAIKRFLDAGGYKAFTTNFEDLHGLKQLPGLAVQRLMAQGYGFGGEGDWKTAALDAVFMYRSDGLKGATGFMEDYTYDLTAGKELVLGAHMLEVSPAFAATKPAIEVHPLGIGGKDAPARLVFDGVTGDGVAATIVDMGGRFRLIAAEIELVKQPQPMPKLPVARVMWKLKPDFKTGAAAWIYAGGAHHTVVTTQSGTADFIDFAKMCDIELVSINGKTDIRAFENKLLLGDAVWNIRAAR